jgi:hypothetical protein
VFVRCRLCHECKMIVGRISGDVYSSWIWPRMQDGCMGVYTGVADVVDSMGFAWVCITACKGTEWVGSVHIGKFCRDGCILQQR